MASRAWQKRAGWLIFWAIAGMPAAPGEARPAVLDGQAAPTGVTLSTSIAHVRGIRTGNQDGASLVEESSRICPTVRRLLDVLQQSDVLVLVEVRDRVLNRTGQLTFMGAANGVRWLRITIDGGNIALAQTAWLAHELQHAVEVAKAAEVKDVEGLRLLLQRIGTDLGGGQFETDAAVATGKQALREAYSASGRRAPNAN
jgi:hypothetical protein